MLNLYTVLYIIVVIVAVVNPESGVTPQMNDQKADLKLDSE